MDYNKMMEEVKKNNFNAVRADDPDYFEAVILKPDLPQLTASLQAHFGPPAFPAPAELSSHIKEVIKDVGGIMAGQTLYFSEGGDFSILAMLWPWQDGLHITLKCGKK